jgi:hypothetical protein
MSEALDGSMPPEPALAHEQLDGCLEEFVAFYRVILNARLVEPIVDLRVRRNGTGSLRGQQSQGGAMVCVV